MDGYKNKTMEPEIKLTNHRILKEYEVLHYYSIRLLNFLNKHDLKRHVFEYKINNEKIGVIFDILNLASKDDNFMELTKKRAEKTALKTFLKHSKT